MFTVARYTSEVDEKYILSALKHGYEGRSYTDKFSPKLIKVLLSDYKKKVHNLKWLLQDDTGRTRNYFEVTPEPKKILDDAKNGGGLTREICRALDALGATYTPETFMANRCTFKKQSQKISRVVFNTDDNVKYNHLNINKEGSSLIILIDDTKVSKARYKFLEGMVLQYREDDCKFILDMISLDRVTIQRPNELSSYNHEDIEKVINNLKSDKLVVSIDLADMITCSTGSCRSCLSVDNIHSAGAIQSFRSEFSLITFTHPLEDRFFKNGRSWLNVRATERGFVRKFPFWKIQKAYGAVNKTHQKLLHNHLEELITELTGVKKWASDDSQVNYLVSTNVTTSYIGRNQTSAPGYIDLATGDQRNWRFPEGMKEYFRYSTECLLPYKDMLSLEGEESNLTSFHQRINSNSYLGATDANNYMVFCKVLGEEVLEQDATQIGGVWYANVVLPQLITGGTYEKPKELIDGQEPADEPQIDYNDVELDEDAF